jgi:hypothetical protein
MKPWHVPKARGAPVPDGNCGCRIEEIHIRFIARMIITNPSLGRVFPKKQRIIKYEHITN